MKGATAVQGERLVLPLTSSSAGPGQIDGAIVLGFDQVRELNESTLALIHQIIELVEVRLEREVLLHTANLERVAWRARHPRQPHRTVQPGVAGRSTATPDYER